MYTVARKTMFKSKRRIIRWIFSTLKTLYNDCWETLAFYSTFSARGKRFPLSSRSDYYEPQWCKKPEQIKLIMECRRSGLSGYQWCQNQGINPGTFYNWVSKLRKAAIFFRIRKVKLPECLSGRKWLNLTW